MIYMNIILSAMKNCKGACKAIHFVYLATNASSNFSRSDVNVRTQLLRKIYSRNFVRFEVGLICIVVFVLP